MPGAVKVVPPPSNTVADPGDDPGVELPHNGDERPDVVISVAPRGMPVGTTGVVILGVILSGEVAPIPSDGSGAVSMPATCATTGPHPKTLARITMVSKRVILVFPSPHALYLGHDRLPAERLGGR